YLALDLIAPPAPTSNPGANINVAASLRSVNYMVNHICEPIQSRRATSSGSDRTLQDGDRAPLTLDEQGEQIFASTDDLAERVRKIGGTTLRSVGQISKLQGIEDNDEGFVAPGDMCSRN